MATIRQLQDGRWRVDYTYPDTKKRVRYRCRTRNEAARVLDELIRQGSPKTSDERRRLSDLLDIWWNVSGRQLKDGERRHRLLIRMTSRLNNPLISEFSASDFLEYRAQRLIGHRWAADDIDPPVSANTVNHEQTYLNALFNTAIDNGYWNGPNPLERVKKIKIDETEMTYLTLEQISELLTVLGSDTPAGIVARFCMSTGARWSEATDPQKLRIVDGRAVFSKTKSGKSRAVPIDAGLAADMQRILKTINSSQIYTRIRKTFSRLDFGLPAGQLTHVFRHTFASYFVMNGGDIVTLQRVLGHSSITMTMIYAHLSPSHLADVVNLNPMARLETGMAQNWHNEKI